MLKIRRPLGRLIFNMGIAIPGKTVFLIETPPWALFQYLRLILVRSHKVSKQRDLYLELYNRSEIWQETRQQHCWCASQISKRCDNLNYQSRGFQTSWDLTIRRLIRYWDRTLLIIVPRCFNCKFATIKYVQDCFLQKEARVCVSNAYVLEDSMFK